MCYSLHGMNTIRRCSDAFCKSGAVSIRLFDLLTYLRVADQYTYKLQLFLYVRCYNSIALEQSVKFQQQA